MKESQLLPSFLISAGIHATFFVVGGLFLPQSVQFAVEQGVSSVEVVFVTMMEKPDRQQVVIQSENNDRVEELSNSKLKEEKIVETKHVEKLSSAKGAQTNAKPDYLSNPAPIYPNDARRLGYEGLVILSVDVDREGNPVRITVKKSTGHTSLDNAAIKAVRSWRFFPARIGQFAMESKVDVPIRFRLEK